MFTDYRGSVLIDGNIAVWTSVNGYALGVLAEDGVLATEAVGIIINENNPDSIY